MVHASARAHINQNEEAYDDEEDDHLLDPSLDTALRLAHHAQRLKAMEISMENFSHALHAFKADQRRLFRRQTIISLIVGAICLVATMGGMLLAQGKHSRAVTAPAQTVAAPAPAAPVTVMVTPPPAAAPSPAPAASPVPVALPAPVAAAPQPAPAVIETPAPPPQPVAMGRYESPAIPRPASAFETAVNMRLAASSQTLPPAWKPVFDREASGDKRAKLQIAAKFLKGEGVKPDPAFAVTLIRQGAEGGNREAMMWLAYSYEAGTFGKPDYATSARWFQEAAKAGVPTAFGELGKLYEKGIDGAPDPETALAWYQRAQAAGDTKAGEAIQRLRRVIVSEGEGVVPAPAPRKAAIAPPAQPQAAILTPANPKDAMAPIRAPMNARDITMPSARSQARAAPAPEEEAPAPAATDEENADPERMADIRAAQRMLKVLGYKIDKPDGAMGPQTQNAIKAWQRDHAAYPDGEFSGDLLEALTQEIRFGK